MHPEALSTCGTIQAQGAPEEAVGRGQERGGASHLQGQPGEGPRKEMGEKEETQEGRRERKERD